MFKPKEVVDTTDIVNQIDYKEGTKFASNGANNVYIDVEELGGFPYLKTVIIGNISERIKRKGCTLTFVFNDGSIQLNSDNPDIESEQLKKTPIHFTQVDFELSEEEAAKIKNEKVIELKYTFKNTYVFKPI